jgi:hypothetical protein
MAERVTPFQQSILRQIEINRKRTPTERMLALCDLLDAARAMAPRDPEACERRRRALAAREREREKMRAHFQRLRATGRADASGSL